MNDQRSAQDQVTELLKIARKHGLYDAEDYVRGLQRGNDEAAPTGSVVEEMRFAASNCQGGMKCIGVAFADWADRVETERKALRDALQWYVDHDDTNDESGNEPFLEGRRRALKALGLEE